MINSNKFTDCQDKAFKLINDFINDKLNTDEILISGRAGSGKSYLISQAINNSFLDTDKIDFLTPTHKARKVLDDFVKENTFRKDIETNTIHSYLKLKRTYKQKKQLFIESYETIRTAFDSDIYIIDESSMIDNDLYDLCRKHLKKIIWVGDKYQLPPINLLPNQLCSLPFELDDEYKTFMSTVVRYSGSILKVADNIIDLIDNKTNTFDYTKYIDDDYSYGSVSDLIKIYLNEYNNGTNCKFITYTNNRTKEINKEIRGLIYGSDADNRFNVGEILNANEIISDIYDTKNVLLRTCEECEVLGFDIANDFAYIYNFDKAATNKKINEINQQFLFYYIDTDKGLIRTIHESNEKKWNSYLSMISELCRRKLLDWKIFHRIKESNHQIIYPYALTANKAQGSTYNYTFVDYKDIKKCLVKLEQNKRLYTAVTRASEKLYLGV